MAEIVFYGGINKSGSSVSSVSASSSWTGKYIIGGAFEYTEPTTGTAELTILTSEIPAGATVNSCAFSYTMGGGSTNPNCRTIRFKNTTTNVTNASILTRLQSMSGNYTDITLVFSYKSFGGNGGSGTHSLGATWTNITLTVNYTTVGGITKELTVSTAGTATCSVDVASLGPRESTTLSVVVHPNQRIIGFSVEVRTASSTQSVKYTLTKTVAANAYATGNFTLELPDNVINAMTSRVKTAFIEVGFETETESFFSGAEAYDGFNLVKNRLAPVISSISWGESDTGFGNHVQGHTSPDLSFSVALDTEADSGITVASRSVELNGTSYGLSTNAMTFDPITSSGEVAYTITVTDSYGQTSSESGTLTILAYTEPSITGLSIDRYTSTLDSGGDTVYVLNDDGTSLWLNGTVSVQTSLGTGTNRWSLCITPTGDETIECVTDSSQASVTYTNNRSLIPGTFDNASDYTFSIVLTDTFTTKTYWVTVLKAGGIFNIESTGVAVGQRSTGTDQNPLFECAYDAKLYGETYINIGGTLYRFVIDTTGTGTGTDGCITFVL